jgi:hypothetical protein
LVNLRAGSGSRTLPPIRPGRSAAKATSRSGLRASARKQPVTARLNGSAGDSFDDGLLLMLDAKMDPSPAVRGALSRKGEGEESYDSATFTELSGNSMPKQR